MTMSEQYANLWTAVQVSLALATAAVITSGGALMVAIMEYYRARWRDRNGRGGRNRGTMG